MLCDFDMRRLRRTLAYLLTNPNSSSAVQLFACVGCQLLVYPGAFNMTTGPVHWELLARARAVDNQCYVAVVSPARDVTASYVAWGHSLVVNPWYSRTDFATYQ